MTVTRNMYIQPSIARSGQFYWQVSDYYGKTLADGYTSSEDQAVRNARNFIRHNQNAVYNR